MGPLFPKSFLHNRWWWLEKKLMAEVFFAEDHGEREREREREKEREREMNVKVGLRSHAIPRVLHVVQLHKSQPSI